ncbi:D-lactate dehydrogenase [Catalinimonas alkaloidigena]|uniref:2-hydroxyacid dehydrogenase n=1 Tax=Catalinimonas alkaloidigena TaxID=1075417 RepID=UPI0024065480|nr:2-hydroxyacid dehydrogenase [Catalinimonas alkaloidigena]MDF9798682.1 D-lactate dehydrogenase [Catalinimonas alkaloidigena]
MKVAFFSTKSYDKEFMDKANRQYQHELAYYDTSLETSTAILANDYEAVCVFVNDQVKGETLDKLHQQGIRLIALRCAGFNNVDLIKAEELDIKVVRVPAYSPYAVAEHALAMILTLNRKTHLAYERVRNGNFSLSRLMGFDLHGRTVGVIGTGKIGQIFASNMYGLGCKVLAYDPYPNEQFEKEGKLTYVSLKEILEASDVLSLHCPLTEDSYHLIDEEAINTMKDEVMLINTSRGGLVDTKAIIKALKYGKIGSLGLDVYEQEENLFFQDLSGHIIQDDDIARLMTFPNVLITSHQAFFTEDAMTNIAETTLQNIRDFEEGKPLENEVKLR